MADEISTVEHEGFTILSNSESADDIRASLSREKPEPKALKEETESLDADGKRRDSKGQFKGTVKPIKDKQEAKPAKVDNDADGVDKPAEKVDKPAAKPAAKVDESPDAEEIARVKAEEQEKETQRRSQSAERVREATSRAAEERRQKEALAAENARLKAQLERGGSPAPEPREGRDSNPRDPGAPEPPDVSKYETLAEYLDARDDYNRKSWERSLEQRQRAAQAEAQARLENEYIAKVVSEAEKALSEPGALDGVSPELTELEPSFMARARGVTPTPWHALADEVLRAGKNGPKLLRYLSDHPEELQGFDHLTRYQFERKMGEINGKLQAVTSAKPAKDDYAPEPFKPVRAVAGQAQHVERDEDEMSMDFDTLASRRLRQGKLLPLRR